MTNNHTDSVDQTIPMLHNLWRRSGEIIACVGVLHLVVFTILGRAPALEIVRAGLFNTIGNDYSRGLVWYGGWLVASLMILLGLFMRSWVRATGQPLPRYIGITMMAVGIAVIFLQPVSGGILVFLAGLVMLSGPRNPLKYHVPAAAHRTSESSNPTSCDVRPVRVQDAESESSPAQHVLARNSVYQHAPRPVQVP